MSKSLMNVVNMLVPSAPGYGVVPSPILFGKPVSSTPISDHTPVHPHYFMTPTVSNPHYSEAPKF